MTPTIEMGALVTVVIVAILAVSRRERRAAREAVPRRLDKTPRLRRTPRAKGHLRLVAALAAVMLFGVADRARAELPHECRRQSALEARTCQNGGLDRRGFGGCPAGGYDVEHDRLRACR